MPLDQSADAITEKHKLNSTGVWLTLLDIGYPDESPPNILRIVNNNVAIQWPTAGGNEYLPVGFDLGDITQEKDGGLPTVTLSIVDISRGLIPILDEYDGGVGAEVRVRIVHSDHLATATPFHDETFEVIDTSVTGAHVVRLKLGASNPMKRRIPGARYLKDHCRYKTFKGTLCGYSGAVATCDRTFKYCRDTVGNAARFGGQPGVGSEAYNG